MEITFRSDNGADILGVLHYLQFAKFFTICRQRIQPTAILYANASPMIEVEPSHTIHNHKGRRQGSHQQPEGRSRHSKIISLGTWRGLKKVWSRRVFWNDRVLEPSKKWSKATAKRKPLAGEPCLTPLVMGNCTLFLPANSTCVMLLQ